MEFFGLPGWAWRSPYESSGFLMILIFPNASHWPFEVKVITILEYITILLGQSYTYFVEQFIFT